MTLYSVLQDGYTVVFFREEVAGPIYTLQKGKSLIECGLLRRKEERIEVCLELRGPGE